MSDFQISSDKPVLDPKNDSLGYADFSKNIASSIIKGNFEDGLVISVYGEWGAGKSTVLSFIEYSLRNDDSDIEIIRFNPWWFSSEEALLVSFFTQLQSVFKTWKSKGKKLAKNIGIISEILAKTPLIEAKAINALLKKLLSSDISKTKNEIEKLLREEKKKIVVIIDDIDRLTGDEAKQVFKIIKAVADFPYVIYILAFDREVVSKSLEKSLNVDGNSYIEKIIQVPFELPLPEENTLSDLFIQQINKLFTDVPEEEHEQTYFGNMYHDGIKYFFKTPRDVIRLTNAISVTFPSVIQDVNYVDFLAIECVRVFEPKIYDGIRRNSELFYGAVEGNRSTELEKERISKIIGYSKKLSSKNMESLLSRLFPKLESILGNTYFGSDHYRVWRKKKRICSNEYFPIYFRSSLSSDSISTSEIKKVLSVSSDRERLSTWFYELVEKKLSTGRSELTVVLNRITDYFDELNHDQIKNILLVCFDIGDDLLIPEDEQEGMFSLGGNGGSLGHIVYRLLPQLDEKMRFDTLKEAYFNGNAVYLMCREVVIFGQQNGKYGSDSIKNNPFITLEQLEELEKITLEKIRDFAEDDKLKLDQNIVGILYRWKKWSGNKEPTDWLQSLIDKDSNNILLLINAFISKSYSHGMSDRIAQEHTKVSIKSIAEFVDITSFEKEVSKLNESELGDEEQLLIKMFQTDYLKFTNSKQSEDDE